MHNSREYYKNILKEEKNYNLYLKNFLKAFYCGGALCLFGEFIRQFLLRYFSEDISNLSLLLIVISIAGILTALGIYDILGEFARCGISIPISGFSNTCVSSAMEYKKEGLALGIGSNCLKLAGAVIVLGTSSAAMINIIRYIFEVFL